MEHPVIIPEKADVFVQMVFSKALAQMTGIEDNEYVNDDDDDDDDDRCQ